MLELSSPGEMDQWIEFFTITESVDASGSVVSAKAPYQTTRPLWAKVTRESGSGIVEADIPTPQARAKVEMRFVPGIVKIMVVEWQSVDWQIVDLDPQPRHDRLFVKIERRGESGDGDPR